MFITRAAMFSRSNPVFTLEGEQTTLPLLNKDLSGSVRGEDLNLN